MSDDINLSHAVRAAVNSAADADTALVLVSRRLGNVMVMVRLPTLSELTDDSRIKLIDSIDDALSTNGADSTAAFVAIRGEYVIGAIETPGHIRKTGRFVSEIPLLLFYR